MSREYQDYLSWTYFGDDAFDRAEFARLQEILRGRDRFIDVGASHGVYTYHANRILENADIIAIEADPERFAILEENARRWQAESTNRIRCINAAASDETDRRESPTITFYTTGTQISGGVFKVEERSDDYAAISVPIVCVDDFFEAEAQTFVKIDVEGAELRALKGATRHITAGHTCFFTEFSWWGDRDRGTSVLDALRFCHRVGLRADRRLRSDYLLAREPRVGRRLISLLRCLPPLALRAAFTMLVPMRIRTIRERRLNKRRLARYADRESSDD
jgi:FkbM family methyltransferase